MRRLCLETGRSTISNANPGLHTWPNICRTSLASAKATELRFSTQTLKQSPVAEEKIEDAILVGDIRLPAEVPHGMRVIADIVAATDMPCMCVVMMFSLLALHLRY